MARQKTFEDYEPTIVHDGYAIVKHDSLNWRIWKQGKNGAWRGIECYRPTMRQAAEAAVKLAMDDGAVGAADFADALKRMERIEKRAEELAKAYKEAIA